MSLFGQIFFGSVMMCICIFVQLIMFATTTGLLHRLATSLNVLEGSRKRFFLFGIAFAVVVLAHTAHVWIWAITLVAISVLELFEDAVYFSLVTYTTLGYGDVTVSNGYRIFSSMAAMTGMLSFGISTAFLVELLVRLSPRRI